MKTNTYSSYEDNLASCIANFSPVQHYKLALILADLNDTIEKLLEYKLHLSNLFKQAPQQ